MILVWTSDRNQNDYFYLMDREFSFSSPNYIKTEDTTENWKVKR